MKFNSIQYLGHAMDARHGAKTRSSDQQREPACFEHARPGHCNWSEFSSGKAKQTVQARWKLEGIRSPLSDAQSHVESRRL